MAWEKDKNLENKWLVKHGHRTRDGSSPTYSTWISMIARCTRESNDNYKYYGAKGIGVCDSWLNSFSCFLSDMGERPEGRTLDRVDGTKGYTKSNCRWATSKEQSINKSSTNVIVFKGKEMTLCDISSEYNIPKTTVYRRYKQGVRGDNLISKENRNKLIKGEMKSNSKINKIIAGDIRKLILKGLTNKDISDIYNISTSLVSDIKNNKAWV